MRHNTTPPQRLNIAAAATFTLAMSLVLFTGAASAGTHQDAPPATTLSAPAQGLLTHDRALKLSPEFHHAEATIAQRRRTTRTTRTRRRYYRSRVSYGPRTVVVAPSAPPARTVVTDPPLRKRRSHRGYSLALRATSLSYGSTQLDRGTLEGDSIAGFGLALRRDLDKHWGVEFALDLAGGQDDLRQIAVTPMSVSLFARLFPESMLDIYGLGGVNVTHTIIDNAQLADESFIQLGAHLGVGAEVKLGHFLLTTDVRYLFLQSRPDPTPTRSVSEQGLIAEDDTPQEPPPRVTEDWNDGIQVSLGLGYRW